MERRGGGRLSSQSPPSSSPPVPVCVGDEQCGSGSANKEKKSSGTGFDICPPNPREAGTVILKPPLHVKNRELRRHGGPKGVVSLRPGMVILKGHLGVSDQVKIVERCRELGLGVGGFYQPDYGEEGTNMHLKMMCLGKNWDPATSRYGDQRPFDGANPPLIPPEFHHFVQNAIQHSNALVPSISSDICIVNFYSQNGRLGLHQDKDETPQSIARGLPVVSFSIGDSAEFLYGDHRDVNQAKKIILDSGDVLIFGGQSRNIFHGVSAIHQNTAPDILRKQTNLLPGRLNLTFRQY